MGEHAEATTPSEVDEPSLEALREAFGLDRLDGASLSEWSRVHRGVDRAGRRVVVKRTSGDRERAAAAIEWTRRLAEAGVAVVTPDVADGPGLLCLDDQWWVRYPWVDGADYRGTLAQVAAVGDWLGRQHAADVAAPAGMRVYAFAEPDRASIEEDLATLAGRLDDVGVLSRLAARWQEQSWPALAAAHRAGRLPSIPVTSDVKAGNYRFAPTGPVMLDPDNAGVEPRVLDLALAVCLFHHECEGAPPRLFDDAEWSAFASAYLRHVELTPVEVDLWPAALDHVLWEEGSWALEDNDDRAWAHPRQGSFLRDLAEATAERFPLPGGYAPCR
ncbi:phosphotransferase enzyme family protein [Pseudokineococcus sp. 1T1Z-3]|uniref:phosphotransferase enzyme family protein n=1 Tax=Pseudokineococcus sp. 1T1Z-3 TaxID=3132745 RepID=UPI0030A9463A